MDSAPSVPATNVTVRSAHNSGRTSSSNHERKSVNFAPNIEVAKSTLDHNGSTAKFENNSSRTTIPKGYNSSQAQATSRDYTQVQPLPPTHVINRPSATLVKTQMDSRISRQNSDASVTSNSTVHSTNSANNANNTTKHYPIASKPISQSVYPDAGNGAPRDYDSRTNYSCVSVYDANTQPLSGGTAYNQVADHNTRSALQRQPPTRHEALYKVPLPTDSHQPDIATIHANSYNSTRYNDAGIDAVTRSASYASTPAAYPPTCLPSNTPHPPHPSHRGKNFHQSTVVATPENSGMRGIDAYVNAHNPAKSTTTTRYNLPTATAEHHHYHHHNRQQQLDHHRPLQVSDAPVASNLPTQHFRNTNNSFQQPQNTFQQSYLNRNSGNFGATPNSYKGDNYVAKKYNTSTLNIK